MDNSRRRFLQIAAITPVAAVVLGRLAPAHADTCADPASLSAAQKSLRNSLEFVEVSTEAAKRCGLCAFYQAKGDCGTCQILSSQVRSTSVCSSFAAKAG
ncbi:MAG: twin-arginine translocation signal domain-containing protein [Novosphingobium sp.]